MKSLIILFIIGSSTCFGQNICDLNTKNWNMFSEFWNGRCGTSLNMTDTDSMNLVLSNDKTYIVGEAQDDDSTIQVISIYTNDKLMNKMLLSQVRKDEWIELYDHQKGQVLNCSNDVYLVRQKSIKGYKWVWNIFYAKEPDIPYFDE